MTFNSHSDVLNQLQRTPLTRRGELLLRALANNYSEGARDLDDPVDSTKLVIIASHPRSASTFLHHILAQLSHISYICGTDAVNDSRPDTDKISLRQREVNLIDAALPGLAGRHPLAVTEPEECMHPMMLVGPSLLYPILFGNHWSRDELAANLHTTYSRYARLLDKLQPNAAHIVLKCPTHYMFHDLATAVFPHARFVSIERDRAANSFIDLLMAIQPMTRQHISRDTVLKEWEELLPAGPPTHAIVLKYRDVVERPMPTVHGLLRDLGIHATTEQLHNAIQGAQSSANPTRHI